MSYPGCSLVGQTYSSAEVQSVYSTASANWATSGLSSTAKSKGWANKFSLILFCQKSWNLFANSLHRFCTLAPYPDQEIPISWLQDTLNGSMWPYPTEPGKVRISSQMQKYAQTAYSRADFSLVVVSSDQTDAVRNAKSFNKFSWLKKATFWCLLSIKKT